MASNPYEFHRFRNEIAETQDYLDAAEMHAQRKEMEELDMDLRDLYLSMCDLFGSYFKE